jgi:hypothetical protein
MKIAIASSGLGHVARGIETWALDTAQALHERGVDVTLFAAAEDLIATKEHKAHKELEETTKQTTKNPQPETHNQEPQTSQSLRVSVVKINCWKRGDERTQQWVEHFPGWFWRLGVKSGYGLEQLTFWFHLWRKLNQGKFDILHVQDPLLADLCRRFRKLGLIKTKEILAHGTEETPDFLKKFDYLQQLAPWHLEQLMATKEHKRHKI